MTAAARLAPPQLDPPAGLHSTAVMSGLDRILEDGVEGVIWERSLPGPVQVALDAWSIGGLEPVRLCVPSSRRTAEIAAVLDAWAGPAPDVRRWLAADIAQLAGRVAQILSASRLLVRIEPVRDDACRKFHKDAVSARLICTYQGPGTEYGEVARLGDQPPHPLRAPTGAALLLKGKLWSGDQSPVLVHRSPPIEATGETRLVVVVDEAPDDLPDGVHEF